MEGHLAGTVKMSMMMQNNHPKHTSSPDEENMLDSGIFTPMRV